VVHESGRQTVDRAAVIVKFVQGARDQVHQIRKEWELRTKPGRDREKFPSIPQGKILIQVIAKNYQTFRRELRCR